MRSVSSNFQAATKFQTREVKARATLKLDALTYGVSLQTNTASSSYNSNMLSQITDNKNFASVKYGTCEKDYTKLDGSFSLMGDTLDLNNNEIGWWGNTLSDDNCVINEVITIETNEFGAYQSTNYLHDGFCIKFDQDCYPTDFTVHFSSLETGDTLTYTITNNSETFYRKLEPNGILRMNKVVITISKMNKPHVRARIVEFTMGLIEEWTDDDIISVNLIEEIDPSFASFPSDSLTITVDGRDNRYDLINKAGMYKYIKQNQEVIFEFGVCLENGLFEWVEMGRYYLKTVTNDSNSLSAKFEFKCYLDVLEDFYYRKKVDAVRFMDYIAAYVVDKDFIPIKLYNPYLDIYTSLSYLFLFVEEINPYTKEMSMKEVIRCLNIISTCMFKLKRISSGTILETRYLTNEPQNNYTIDLDNSYLAPKIEEIEKYSKIQVKGHTMTISDSTTTSTVNGFTIRGEFFSYVSFGGPGIVTLIMNGTETVASNTSFDGSYLDSDSGLYVASLYNIIVTNNGVYLMLRNTESATTSTLNLAITYKTMSDNSKETIITTNYTGKEIAIDNELIDNGARYNIGTYVSMHQPLQKITCDWRGNPALECFDKIKVQDAYNNLHAAYVTKNSYTYEGYLKCITELQVMS